MTCVTGFTADDIKNAAKVEIVEPEPLWIEGQVIPLATEHGPTTYRVDMPESWCGLGVIVIRKSDLPEALKQLEATTTPTQEKK